MYTNVCNNLCTAGRALSCEDYVHVPATEDAQSTYTKLDEYSKGILEW